jgi:hypothetical protein
MVFSELAKEGLSRGSLDVDVHACSAPAAWLVIALLDDRGVLEVSKLYPPCDKGSGLPGGHASQEDGEQHGDWTEP